MTVKSLEVVLTGKLDVCSNVDSYGRMLYIVSFVLFGGIPVSSARFVWKYLCGWLKDFGVV